MMSIPFQTPDALVFDTPYLELTVAGVWEKENAPAENVIYCGTSREGSLQKQLIIAIHLLAADLSEEKRLEAFEWLLETRRTNEREATQGGIRLFEEPVQQKGELLLGGYAGFHPSATRIVFSRAACDRKKAINFYYSIWGFTTAPNIGMLSEEFEKIMDTVRLK